MYQIKARPPWGALLVTTIFQGESCFDFFFSDSWMIRNLVKPVSSLQSRVSHPAGSGHDMTPSSAGKISCFYWTNQWQRAPHLCWCLRVNVSDVSSSSRLPLRVQDEGLHLILFTGWLSGWLHCSPPDVLSWLARVCGVRSPCVDHGQIVQVRLRFLTDHFLLR